MSGPGYSCGTLLIHLGRACSQEIACRMRLLPFDATTDALTRRPQLDERIVRMYSVLHDMDLNSDDVQVFCRLYTAIVDKAVDLQFDRAYGKGYA